MSVMAKSRHRPLRTQTVRAGELFLATLAHELPKPKRFAQVVDAIMVNRLAGLGIAYAAYRASYSPFGKVFDAKTIGDALRKLIHDEACADGRRLRFADRPGKPWLELVPVQLPLIDETPMSEARMTATPTHQHTEQILQYFNYAHLVAPLAEVSRPFCELAETIVATLPRGPERTVALRKLLEAKDAAVRAAIAAPVDSVYPAR